MKLQCIAIDDEPKALDIIELYCKKVPFIELEKSFRDSLEALDYVQNNATDLIFLDINMPDLNGIEFLQAISNHPMIIFTTAYSEYAVESYEYKAIDYLLKPITFSRFLKAANRALDQKKTQTNKAGSEIASTQNIKPKHIILKSGSESYKVNLDEILFIEGAQNYIFVHTTQHKVMTLMRMKEIETLLPSGQFIRIHKSYIVNFNFLEKIESYQVTIKDATIPIGKIYRESFRKELRMNYPTVSNGVSSRNNL